MFVCVCHAVTDREIREAVDDGVADLDQLQAHCGAGSGCGCCKAMAQELIDAHRMEAQAYAA